MKISYIIPVLNEEDSLFQLYQEIRQNNPEPDYEIIFIDDGSRDQSYELLCEIADKDEKVKVIRFRRNFGKAAALQAGFHLAEGDLIFTLDADLQDDPAEIPNFIAKINEGYDLVSGWKKKRHDPITKTLPSKFFNFVTARTFKLHIKDFNCGFKLYRKPVVKELYIYGEMHRYIPVLANALGFSVTEIPVNHRYRKYGKSKYGIERYLRGFFDLLTVKMVTQYVKSPLYLFGRIGVISGVIGVLIAGYLAIRKIFYNYPLSNRPLLFLGILLILTGVQLFSMGLISELIINRSLSREIRISIKEVKNIPPEKISSFYPDQV